MSTAPAASISVAARLTLLSFLGEQVRAQELGIVRYHFEVVTGKKTV